MDNKPTDPAASSGEEFKDNHIKYVLSKFEYDLYTEEDDIALPVIRVKHFSLPNKGEKWKVMNDTKVIFVIEGNKVSKKEREFLQTIEGFNFILSQAKAGIKSLNGFRGELKKIISKASTKKSAKKQKKRGRPKTIK
jgi:hypothetical protein